MSIFLSRPQCANDVRLNIGDEYSRPNMLFPCDEGTSPGIDTEIIEEIPDIFDALLYDQGDDAGFVLVQES